jgi:hypothetical protein
LKAEASSFTASCVSRMLQRCFRYGTILNVCLLFMRYTEKSVSYSTGILIGKEIGFMVNFIILTCCFYYIIYVMFQKQFRHALRLLIGLGCISTVLADEAMESSGIPGSTTIRICNYFLTVLLGILTLMMFKSEIKNNFKSILKNNKSS